MTFTFQFSPKTSTSIQTKDNDHQEEYNAKMNGNDSECEQEQTDDEVIIMGGEDTDVILYNPGDEDGTEYEDGSSDDVGEATVFGSESDDWSCVGTFDECLDSFRQENNEADNAVEDCGKKEMDSNMDLVKFPESIQVEHMDSWNFDALNWYTKSDQLAVQDALENQIIAIDAFGV